MSQDFDAEGESRETVDHFFGYLFEESKRERAVLGLPKEFKYLILAQSYSANDGVAEKVVEAFNQNAPIDSLKELVRSRTHGKGSGHLLALIDNRETLFEVSLALYRRGENDMSCYDYHRFDSSLVHFTHVRLGNSW